MLLCRGLPKWQVIFRYINSASPALFSASSIRTYNCFRDLNRAAIFPVRDMIMAMIIGETIPSKIPVCLSLKVAVKRIVVDPIKTK